jgi:hypothetical protein
MWSWAGCTEWSGEAACPAGGLEGISESKLQAAMQQCLALDRSEASSTDTKSKSLYLPFEQFLNPEFETEALKLVTHKSACQSGACFIQLSFVGGAMTVHHSNSVFVHRTPGWHLQSVINWNRASDRTLYMDWARKARATIYPFGIGEAYQNYPDNYIDLSTWSAEYFPKSGVFDSLIATKCKDNPSTVFDLAHVSNNMIPRRC